MSLRFGQLLPTFRSTSLRKIPPFCAHSEQRNNYISVSPIRYQQAGQVKPIPLILPVRIQPTLTGSCNKIKDNASARKAAHNPSSLEKPEGTFNFVATLICMDLKRQKLIGIISVDNGAECGHSGVRRLISIRGEQILANWQNAHFAS